MRMRGEMPAGRSGLDAPRGFNAAPVAARRNYQAGSEEALRSALREIAANDGGVVTLSADFAVFEPIVVDTDRTIIQGNMHVVELAGEAASAFEIHGTSCVVRDVVVGSGLDSVVPTATGFVIADTAELTMIDNCHVRATTFLDDSGSLTYARGSFVLTSAGGSWASYTYP